MLEEKYFNDSAPNVDSKPNGGSDSITDAEPVPPGTIQSSTVADIEDVFKKPSPSSNVKQVSFNKKKRKRNESAEDDFGDKNASSWREALGSSPSCENLQVTNKRSKGPANLDFCLKNSSTYCLMLYVIGMVSISEEEMGLAEISSYACSRWRRVNKTFQKIW